eukprot:CAMPEP_0115754442 /NCGR_PEP_ID=MMETSP0272-20121206/96873_1 /TAXON_ID=71861 /ORGANISM="Scrippsiella trochoidea, Strain CCMP3099" /LENGTH=978 /DNA_ID=CAMNT_0003199851 /DNA_START=126 /DNA_END=3064 /DNA_ORIENTATION=+
MTIEDDEGQYRQFAMGEANAEEEDEEELTRVLSSKSPEVRKILYDHKAAMLDELEAAVRIDTHDTVFMVALQLPLTIVRGESGGWKIEENAPMDGRNFAWLPLLQEFRKKTKVKIVCVGWPGVHVDSFRERSEIEKLLKAHDCIPVFPDRQDFEKYVNFCTTFLWPVFHDVMLFFQASKPVAFDEHGWAAYQHMNNLYANAVVPHTHESDIVWVHDYHMMMTPTFISRKLVKANIGFYLHTPFPSSDSFKSLPIREELLLSGMLCADQLGFQFFAYARNFLVCVKRIFGHDPSFKAGGFCGVEANGRHVMLKVAHFVYPFQATKEVARSSIVVKKAAELKELFKGKTVLRAWTPEYKGKAVLVQYTFDTACRSQFASALWNSLQGMVDAHLKVDVSGALKIIFEDGDQDSEAYDIVVRSENMDRIDRLALFRAADVLLDTSVKAGLNLMPFEFITAHHDDDNKHSVAIVSEFSGCSRVLLGSIRVNPWNIGEVVIACERAMKMEPMERKELNECNLVYVSESSPCDWFMDFLMDLRRARKKEGIRIESIGFGAKIRHVCMTQDFKKLPHESVLAAYRSAKNRLLFLDNEGTLAPDNRNLHREYGAPKGDVSDLKSNGNPPNQEVLDCLRSLCQDQRNTVVILSGRNQPMLEQWFSSVPNLGLAAERGFYYRLPTTGGQWKCMKQNPDYTWQSYAFEIMRQFVKRTQGSFIESKGSALVWQYRDADQHFGSWQAKELSSLLQELLFGFDVDVLNGKGYVEVKLQGINKGVACSKVLTRVSQTFGEVDFVLCIGDDRSDEDMFEAMNAAFAEDTPTGGENTSQLSTTDGESDDGRSLRLAEKAEGNDCLLTVSEPRLGSAKGMKSAMRYSVQDMSTLATSSLGRSSQNNLARLASGSLNAGEETVGRRIFTCTVGRKPSAAKFYLDDVDEVSDLLNSLKQQHNRSHKDTPPSYHTWSGGDMRKGMRVGSMPALSSLAFPR